MRRVTMQPAAWLVGEQGLAAPALFLPATGCLCGGHRAAHRPRCLLSLGPPTAHQAGTRRFACAVHRLARAQPARLETRAERLQAAGRACPRRHGARGRAARGGPARRLQRVRPPRPLACPLAPPPHLHSRWAPPPAACDAGARACCGQVPLRGWAHAPRQRQGAPFRDDMEPQRGTPTAPAAAIHDAPHCLPGAMTPPDVCRGQKVHLLQDLSMVAPPGKAFAPALGLGAIGHLGGEVGQWGALPAHDAAQKRGEGRPVPGAGPGGLARISV
jgi:hypothetical protein